MAINRRNFLRNTAGAGLVTSGLFLPWRRLALAAEQSQSDFDDYKAMVYVMFNGGMDSFNLLVPYDDDEYKRYAKIRSDLKYERDELLVLDDSETDRRFSVPSMAPEIRDLFNDGDLAFLANVGPLTEHMDREKYLDETEKKPLNLESHSDQIAQWQSTNVLTPLSKQTVGWLGRVSDCFGSTLNNGLSMNVSVSGFNLVQTGESGTPVLNPTTGLGRDPFQTLSEDYLDVKETANQDFEFGGFDGRYENLMQKEYVERFKHYNVDASEANLVYNRGYSAINTSFGPEGRDSETHFGSSMQRIVQFISAHWTFGGAKRQTFYVNFGGWDHHENLKGQFHDYMEDVSFVLKAFRDALVEIDMLDNVVLCTASDFGRTLTSNGGGSDHGWGGNAMILGGPVKGKRVLGQYPEMDLEGSQISNTERGNFIPTTSLEEYYAELSLWFGLDEENLKDVLPNADAFIPDGATKPESIGIFEESSES